MTKNTLVLIYPVHLYENIEQIANSSYTYCLIEEPLYFSSDQRVKYFNGIKLLLHRVSMKLYQQRLIEKHGFQKVIYLDYEYVDKKLPELITSSDHVIYYDPVDHLLQQKLDRLLKTKKVQKLESPGFICSTQDLRDFIKSQKDKKRQYFHQDFYRWQRKRLDILMDENGKYLGGKLTYDKENRGGISNYQPITVPSPTTSPNSNDSLIKDSIRYIKTKFYRNDPELLSIYCNSISDIKEKNWQYLAFDHQTAKNKLSQFLQQRLITFGTYQDIVVQDNPWISHSLISSSLNIGLLTPDYVVKQTLKYYYANIDQIELNNVEGFIRQIIGWREYYRMVYLDKYNELVSSNIFNHNRKLNRQWYHGTTGIQPIDHHIKLAFKTGYLHHIVRLMLIGQFMLLCQIDPHQIYQWFMEFAIDSYDWVMVPNVYGMVGYNDGGETTTKVYISSSNYVLKMSDFSADGYWDQIWTALYYYFINCNYELLSSNPRSRFMIWNYDRLSSDKLEHHLTTAKRFIKEKL